MRQVAVILVNKKMVICPRRSLPLCSSVARVSNGVFLRVACFGAIMASFAKDYSLQGHGAGCETDATSQGISLYSEFNLTLIVCPAM